METLDHLMRSAVAHGVFPGAVLLVARAGRVLFHESYGLANLLTRQPMHRATLFDLASLTKPLATTLAVMHLVAQGRLQLDSALGDLLPALKGGDKGTITIAQLLGHAAGLPAYRPYFLTFSPMQQPENRQALRALLAAEPLSAPPGKQVLYSDLGFMLLAWVLETVTQDELDHLVQARVYHPIGLRDLFFLPTGIATPQRDMAATEICPWRGCLMAGQVHDENSWLVGGVDGQAGLFGTAEAVFHLLSALLRDYAGRGPRRLFPVALLRTFWLRSRGWERPLGFDAPAERESSSGRFFPMASVGHLGFTGTSFWIDLDREMIVILLSNRVHPSRSNVAIREFRPRLHDAVMKSVASGGTIF